MREQDGVRKFEYRPCRVIAAFIVEFVAGDNILYGLCRDVSDAGIRAQFDCLLGVGSNGLLILRHSTGVLKREAQVAYVRMGQTGFVFLSQTPWDRRMTIEFIAKSQTASPGDKIFDYP